VKKGDLDGRQEVAMDVGREGIFLDKAASSVLGCPKFKSDSSFNGVCSN
jgi:hypothetical protein